MSAGRNRNSRTRDRKSKVRKALRAWKEHRREVRVRKKAQRAKYRRRGK